MPNALFSGGPMDGKVLAVESLNPEIRFPTPVKPLACYAALVYRRAGRIHETPWRQPVGLYRFVA